nr:MAG TPA: hypothetical protein [Caudoviricetes sp.]
MKVTQVIKEAITARVKAKCDEANKSANLLLNVELERLAEERKQQINALQEEYQKTFMAMLEKLDNKKISYYYSSYNKKITSKEELCDRNIPCVSIELTSDYAEELKKKILDNETKAKKYINDIILELELGATKPTLESLLNNITF